MRSTQKKGPRTRAVRRMHKAASAAALAQLIWKSTSAMFAATSAAKRADGFRKSSELEPTTQNNPINPPPMSGGAEACKEISMPNVSPEELQRQHHEIARMAADAAGRLASHIPYDRQALSPMAKVPSPASAGKAVADAYQAALKQLSADCALGTPTAAASA